MNETVREMTKKQFKDLIATFIGAVPDDLSFQEAKILTGRKGKVVADVKQVIEELAGRSKELILQPISGDQKLVLPASNGQRTIAQADKVFTDFLDSDFKNWGTDKPAKATPETQVQVYEMAKDANFAQIFGSLASDVDQLCLTQDQIISFVEKHPNWLRTDGYGTFFLFKIDDQFFVALVYLGSAGELFVSLRRFEHDRLWRAGSRHRVVVPQQQ